MKRILSALLAVMMCIGMMATASFAAEVTFTDIKSGDWFYEDVKSAVEMGLVNGKSPTRFAPNDKLTYSEAIKLAACMHQRYTKGSVTLTNGNPWYMPYVEYCKTNGIISKDYNPTEMVTRAGYIEIFAKALPDEGFKVINNIPDNAIPDVPMTKSYAPAVYKLYRAGILAGVNEAHYCNPDANITRAEVATILVRMMKESARMAFGMGTGSGAGGSGSEGGSGGEGGSGSEGGSGGGGEETPVPEAKPLAISAQPIGKSAKTGETVKTTVAVTGGKAPYTYRWQVETTMPGGASGWFKIEETNSYFEGEATDTLSITMPEKGEKKVRCIITDANDEKLTSNEATFTFTTDEIPLSVKVATKSLTAEAGESVMLVASEQGGKAPYTHQWQIKGDNGAWTNISDNPFFTGTNTSALTVALTEASVEYFRCVITDANGKTATTEEITLTVNELVAPFAIKTQPVGITIEVNQTGNLSVAVTGGKAPYTYQWQMNSGRAYMNISDNAFLSGTKTDKLSLKSASEVSTDFRCVITDASGAKLTTNIAKVKVVPATLTLAEVKFKTEGIGAASAGVFVWGKLETGLVKEGDVLYLNDANNNYLATINVKKLEKDKQLVTSINAADAGASTIGILTDLDAAKWKNANVSGCIVSSKKGSVITMTDGTSRDNYVVGTISKDPLKITAQPQSMTILKEAEVANAYFSVEVSGGKAPYTYQWYLGDKNSKTGVFEYAPMKDSGYSADEYIMGTTTDTLTISTKKVRAYIVYCVITDANGNKVQSNTVSLSRP